MNGGTQFSWSVISTASNRWRGLARRLRRWRLPGAGLGHLEDQARGGGEVAALLRGPGGAAAAAFVRAAWSPGLEGRSRPLAARSAPCRPLLPASDRVRQAAISRGS
jgi:hypothetical protein